MAYGTISNARILDRMKASVCSWMRECNISDVIVAMGVVLCLTGLCTPNILICGILCILLAVGVVKGSHIWGTLNSTKGIIRAVIGRTSIFVHTRTTGHTVARIILRILMHVIPAVVQAVIGFTACTTDLINRSNAADMIIMVGMACMRACGVRIIHEAYFAPSRVVICVLISLGIQRAPLTLSIEDALEVLCASNCLFSSTCLSRTAGVVCLLFHAQLCGCCDFLLLYPLSPKVFSIPGDSTCRTSYHAWITYIVFIVVSNARMHKQLRIMVRYHAVHTLISLCISSGKNIYRDVLNACINEQSKYGSRTFFNINIKRSTGMMYNAHGKRAMLTNNFVAQTGIDDTKNMGCQAFTDLVVQNSCLKELSDKGTIVVCGDKKRKHRMIEDCTYINVEREDVYDGRAEIETEQRNAVLTAKWKVTQRTHTKGLTVPCKRTETKRKRAHNMNVKDKRSTFNAPICTKTNISHGKSSIGVQNEHGSIKEDNGIVCLMSMKKRDKCVKKGINLFDKTTNTGDNVLSAHDCHNMRTGALMSYINILILSLLILPSSSHYIMHNNFYLHAINRKVVLSRDRTSFKIEKHGAFSKLRVRDLYMNEHMRLNTKGSHFMIERVIKNRKDSSDNPSRHHRKEYYFALRRKNKCLAVCGNELKMSHQCSIFRFGTANNCDFDFVRMFREGVFVQPFSDALVFIKKMTECVDDKGLNGCGVS